MSLSTTYSFPIPLRKAVFLAFLLRGSGTLAEVGELPSFSFLEEPSPAEFSLTVPLIWQETGEVRVAFQTQPSGDGYYALCSPQEQGFFKVQEGETVVLASSPFPETPFIGERLDLTLQRGPWRMALLLGDQVVARAWDAEFSAGKIGLWASDPAWWAGEPHLQPREEIFQTDDFMRTEDALGDWEVLQGTWAPSGPELQYATTERSANPFTYRTQVEPHQEAWATTGYGFWSNYGVEVSVKPEGEGAIGVGLFVQDAENHLLFRWTSSPHTGSQQWILVKDGKETLLAEAPGGYVPNQWVRLRVETVDGQLCAWVDGREVLRTRTDLFGQGLAGLYAQAEEAPLAVHFDDLLIESVRDFHDEGSDDGGNPWTHLQGSWRKEVDGSYRCEEKKGLAWSLMGPSEWQHYRYQATVDPPQTGWVGLCFGYRDPGHYGLLKLGPNQAQLIRVAGGEQEVLDHTTVVPLEEEPFPLSVQLEQGFLQATVGDATLAGFAPDLMAGPVGLMAEHYAGRVRGIEMEFLSLSFPLTSGKASFQADPNMRAWATSAGEWQARQGGVWHKARLYGTTTVELAVPPFPEESSLEIVLGADEDGAGGYRFTLTPEEEGVSWELARGDRSVASRERDSSLGSWPASIRFQRRGPFLAAWANDHLFALFRDPQPLPGMRVILRPRNLQLDLTQCHVFNEHGWDDSFHQAPVDWWVGRGTWSLAQRWTCSGGGQWTFFGGFNDLACVLWSKRTFAGDQTLEFFVGPATIGGSHSREQRDFNAVICGDGANLDSGYTLVLGGRDGRNRLYRKGLLLTEGSGSSFSGNSGDWPAVRLEKHGGRLQAFFQERLILEATDPEPLEGGQVAVWTYHNNILLPRARVWAQEQGPVQPFPVLPPPSALPEGTMSGPTVPPGVPSCNNDFERGLGAWSAPHEEDRTQLSLDETTTRQGLRSLKVVNARAGGYFTVRPTQEPVDVARFPVLHFDYRVPPEVKVNLYLRVAGAQGSGSDWWEIAFTGPEGPTREEFFLGAISEVVADQEWHHAVFDVGGALEKALGGPGFTVQGVAFSAPQRDYLTCGLGGNPFGATYHLDDFGWKPRE